MALNLSRNTVLFVSTAVPGTDTIDSDNTWEVPVIDGYTFSQDATAQTITLNEAGNAPVRGQKIFNTAINPVELSFPTYVRPFYDTTHQCNEQILWEGLVGVGGGTSDVPAFKYALDGSSYMEANFKGSEQHELLKLYLYFQLENTTYRVNEVALNSAEIDFSIDGIATITWNGQGKSITEVDTSAWAAGVDYTASTTTASFIKNKLSSLSVTESTGTTSGYQIVDYNDLLDTTVAADYDGASTYTATVAVDGGTPQSISIDDSAFTGTTVQDYLNEMNYQLDDAIIMAVDGNLTVISSSSGSTSSIAIVDGGTALFATLDTTNYTAINSAVAGTGTPKIFNIPITGGSLTVENNITYLTPEELGKVNEPIGSFTGTRSVTGTVTAYLNTGSNASGGLLADLVADTATVTSEFEITMHMGGSSNTPRVDFIMNHAHLVIPSINVEDVISTEINLTGLGEEITEKDELLVRYYAQ